MLTGTLEVDTADTCLSTVNVGLSGAIGLWCVMVVLSAAAAVCIADYTMLCMSCSHAWWSENFAMPWL